MAGKLPELQSWLPRGQDVRQVGKHITSTYRFISDSQRMRKTSLCGQSRSSTADIEREGKDCSSLSLSITFSPLAFKHQGHFGARPLSTQPVLFY